MTASLRLPCIVELCMHFLQVKKIRAFFMLVCHQTAKSLLRCFFDSSSLYSFSKYTVLIGFFADIANCLARQFFANDGNFVDCCFVARGLTLLGLLGGGNLIFISVCFSPPSEGPKEIFCPQPYSLPPT